jgi:transglutaminase-like putative cysteine protease
MDRRKAMEQAVSQIISPSDSADTKLRKIYARCQEVKNLDFERRGDSPAQEKPKANENVEDVWKSGVGTGRDINLLFLALTRAAGFEAYFVRLSGRSEYFFKPQRMNAAELEADAVLVKSEGKDLYLDPATKFAPYGLMPWAETGVSGLRIDRQGGTWIRTPLPGISVTKGGAASGPGTD